jgi:uncharacterized protein DUF3237
MTHPELTMEVVARLEVLIAEPIDAGVTPAGHRRVIPITGGTVTGPRLTGEVLGIGAAAARGIKPRSLFPEIPGHSSEITVPTRHALARPLGVSLEFHQIRVK